MHTSTAATLASLILVAACSDPAVNRKELAAAIAKAGDSVLATQPTLRYQLVAFDGNVAAVDVWFDAAPGTSDSSLTLTSVTLDGTSPSESLPLKVGPVLAGKRAAAQLHFEGPKWKVHRMGGADSSTEYETVFAYRATTQHAVGESAANSECSSSMPLWVRDDSPLHGQMMRSFGDGQAR